MKTQQDVIYDAVNHLALDIYQPDASRGVLLLIHGGGWFRGDKSKEAFLAEKFVAAGYTVVAPNYRLAPDTLFPGAMEDILLAYDWVAKSSLMADPQPIFALGASAGGNLSIELALQRGIPAASWSGIIDMSHWISQHPNTLSRMNQEQHFDEHESRDIDQSGSNDQFYKWFILNYVASDMALLDEATPLIRVRDTSGPLFLANSLHELVPTSGVLMLQQALLAHDVVSEVKLIAGQVHGEGYWEQALPATLAFFQEYLPKSATKTA